MEKKRRIIWPFKHKDSFLLSGLRLCNYCRPVLAVDNFHYKFSFDLLILGRDLLFALT